jgi:hypothetical protein
MSTSLRIASTRIKLEKNATSAMGERKLVHTLQYGKAEARQSESERESVCVSVRILYIPLKLQKTSTISN